MLPVGISENPANIGAVKMLVKKRLKNKCFRDVDERAAMVMLGAVWSHMGQSGDLCY